MSRLYLVAAIAVAAHLAFSDRVQAQTQTPASSVQISGVIGNSRLIIGANNNNLTRTFTGTGRVQSTTGQAYYLKITGGQVALGQYVSLTGTCIVPGSTVTSTFTLTAQNRTGAIILSMYGTGGAGSNGVRQTGSGTVVIR